MQTSSSTPKNHKNTWFISRFLCNKNCILLQNRANKKGIKARCSSLKNILQLYSIHNGKINISSQDTLCSKFEGIGVLIACDHSKNAHIFFELKYYLICCQNANNMPCGNTWIIKWHLVLTIEIKSVELHVDLRCSVV